MKGCTLLCLLCACLVCLQTCLQLYIGFCSCSGIRDVHELNLALRAPVGLVGALAFLRKHDNRAHLHDLNAGRDWSRGSRAQLAPTAKPLLLSSPTQALHACSHDYNNPP